jgi:hypothetical protein
VCWLQSILGSVADLSFGCQCGAFCTSGGPTCDSMTTHWSCMLCMMRSHTCSHTQAQSTLLNNRFFPHCLVQTGLCRVLEGQARVHKLEETAPLHSNVGCPALPLPTQAFPKMWRSVQL